MLKLQVYYKTRNYVKMKNSVFFIFEYLNLGNMLEKQKVLNIFNFVFTEKDSMINKYNQNFGLTDFLNILIELFKSNNKLLLQFSSMFFNPKFSSDDLKYKYFLHLLTNINKDSKYEIFLEMNKVNELSEKFKNILSKLFLKKIFDENLTRNHF